MAPLRRCSQAPRGQTPPLRQRGSHREKISVAAMLWKTPRRGLVRLLTQSYLNANVTAEAYAELLRELLREVGGTLCLLHDENGLHWGEAVEDLVDEYPHLTMHWLPPYAPELNPVEELWDYLKYDQLANFAPQDVAHLDRVVTDQLFALHRDQPRLRTFLASSPLQW